MENSINPCSGLNQFVHKYSMLEIKHMKPVTMPFISIPADTNIAEQ